MSDKIITDKKAAEAAAREAEDKLLANLGKIDGLLQTEGTDLTSVVLQLVQQATGFDFRGQLDGPAESEDAEEPPAKPGAPQQGIKQP